MTTLKTLSLLSSVPMPKREASPSRRKLPPSKSTSDALPRLQLSFARSNSNMTNATSGTTPDLIQSTWSAFNHMSDSQRNQLLKGLLARCNEKQTEVICTTLNLKAVEGQGYLEQTVVPSKVTSKYIASGVVSARHFHARGVDGVVDTKPLAPKEAKLPLLDRTRPNTNEDTIFPLEEEPSGAGSLAIDGGFVSSRSPPIDRSENTNLSLYIRLLSTSQSASAIANYLLKSNPDDARAFIVYLSTRIRKYKSILATLTELGNGKDQSQVIDDMLVAFVDAVDAKYVTFYGLDGVDCTVRGSNWRAKASTVGHHLLYGSSTVIRGNIVNAYDLKEDLNISNEILESYAAFDLECILSVPVYADDGRIVGILEFVNKTTGSPLFTIEDDAMAIALAGLLTILVTRQDVGGGVTQDGADVRAFLNTASAMTNEVDVGDLIAATMQTAKELINAERCSLFILDRESKELWTTVAQGTGEIRIPMSTGIAGHVAMTGQLLNIPNAYKDPRFNRDVDLKTGFRTRNILCVPMKPHGDTIGVMQVINKLPDTAGFTKGDETLLSSFGVLAGGMLERFLMYKKLQTRLHEVDASHTVLSHAFHNAPTIIMMLDARGYMSTINNPAKLSLPSLSITQNSPYDTWLGINTELVEDIKRVYESGEEAYNDEFYYSLDEEESICVSYLIVPAKGGGVVVIFNETTAERRMARLLGRLKHA
ncbi:hypothetical protein BC832DRAFT_425467 [Gaertneriomyces semiglobifer]|nr:hypothetical protein BC832DRAFT_425467 [Gaertneriomyces semiglobifer]